MDDEVQDDEMSEVDGETAASESDANQTKSA